MSTNPTVQQDNASDIFLSYAREDISIASELARELESEGWSVWWDREIHPGQDFELEIDSALTSAKVVVVLWSTYSVASTWVRNEAKEAKELNKLIPVLLDDSRIPLSFRALSTIALTGYPDRRSEVDLSLFKSAIKRVMSDRGAGPRLKKPVPVDGDAYSLSVRVASRVADMVKQAKPDMELENHLTQKLIIERCITDICLDLLTTKPEKLLKHSHIHFVKLGIALQAKHLVLSSVDYATLSVASLSSIDEKIIPSSVEEKVLRYVNDYCVSDSENGLHCTIENWPEKQVLCVPCPTLGETRDFVWFLAASERGDWSFDVQDRLLLLSQALHNVWGRNG